MHDNYFLLECEWLSAERTAKASHKQIQSLTRLILIRGKENFLEAKACLGIEKTIMRLSTTEASILIATLGGLQ